MLSLKHASISLVTVIFFTFVGSVVSAQPLIPSQPLADKPLAEPVVDSAISKQIYQRLQKARPELLFSHLEPSPVKGMYKVKVNGQLAFVSEDGGHLIAGEMYEVQEGNLVNLQEEERRQAEVAFEPERAKLLSAVKQEDMVIFKPEGEVKGHIYVFTDIDCGFCRRLHSGMQAMLDKGIEVRYLAFPRAGPDSKSAQKLATTWCAKNSQELMTRYKKGENVPLAPCDNNPVADQFMLGNQVGVSGTPAIVLASGKLIPGAVSPDFLAKEMGI